MPAATRSRAPFADPRIALLVLVVTWLLLGGLFRADFQAMLRMWSTSATFTYGFLVFPGVLFLAWQRRAALRTIPASPAWPALLPVIGATALWLLGWLADLQAARQLGAVLLLIFSFWLILGKRLARAFAWPLLFMLFLVPEGQFMIPRLMSWTADFAVVAARLSGIPVFRDGMLLTIPSGDFEIIQACSGVRFLLASVALGWFMSGAVFRDWRRRLVLLAAAVVVPLIANGLRAYLIILLGHLSDMRLVADHVLIGQIFFSLVFFVMCWLSLRYSDVDSLGFMPLAGTDAVRGAGPASLIAAATACLVAAAAGPLLSASVRDQLAQREAGALPVIPEPGGDWPAQGIDAVPWSPRYAGASDQLRARLGSVDATIVIYEEQSEGAELVNARNELFDPDEWTSFATRRGRVEAERPLRYNEVELRSASQQVLLRYWFLLDGDVLLRAEAAKLRALAQIFRVTRPVSSVVMVGARFEQDPATAAARLDAFLKAWCAAPVPAASQSPCGGR